MSGPAEGSAPDETSPEASRLAYANTAAYERLESLVSIRFRRAFQGTPSAGHGPGVVAPGSHVLQIRHFDDDGNHVIAGLWTAPDGRRTPFLHAATERQTDILEDFIKPRSHPGTGSDAPGAGGGSKPNAPDQIRGRELEDQHLPTAFRAEPSDWISTRRYARLASSRWGQWSELADLVGAGNSATLCDLGVFV